MEEQTITKPLSQTPSVNWNYLEPNIVSPPVQRCWPGFMTSDRLVQGGREAATSHYFILFEAINSLITLQSKLCSFPKWHPHLTSLGQRCKIWYKIWYKICDRSLINDIKTGFLATNYSAGKLLISAQREKPGMKQVLGCYYSILSKCHKSQKKSFNNFWVPSSKVEIPALGENCPCSQM